MRIFTPFFMRYFVNILNCDFLGTELAVEIARILDPLNGDVNLYLYDTKKVKASDIGRIYYPEDLGLSRAGALSAVINDNLVNVKSVAYVQFNENEYAQRIASKRGYGHKDTDEMHIFFCFDKCQQERILTLKQSMKNMIIICKDRDKISSSVKLLGMEVNPENAIQDISETGDLRDVRLMLSLLCHYASGSGELPLKSLLLDEDLVGCGKELIKTDRGISGTVFTGDKLVVVLGCGGTGGAVIKHLLQELLNNPGMKLLFIDGDRVEEKNLARQPFAIDDVNQFKADALKNEIHRAYPELTKRVFAYSNYIDTAEQLASVIGQVKENCQVALIGCVDNHRARQCAEKYYKGCKDILYIDAANEWSNGEVVISIRKDGIDMSPLRSDYFPEVLEDNGPSASEMSCGAINEVAPQHLVTNLTSAQNVLVVLKRFIEDEELEGGIIFFDSFKCYGRFQPVMN